MIVDQQLIEGCKSADEKSQRILFERYSPIMYGICLSYCKNSVEAEDYVQEGFISIFSKIDQYSGEGNFIAWMRRIMINTVLMGIRAKKKENNIISIDNASEIKIQTDDSEISDESIKASIQNADFSTDEILDAANSLPEGYRAVFNLHVVEGYKHQDIAKALGIKESTSKSQLLRARKQLQKKLYELSLDKNKKKDKRKLVYAFAFFAMNDNLDYIDEIMKKGYEDLKVPPSKNWHDVKEGMNANSSSSVSNISESGQFAGSSQGIQNSLLQTINNAGSNILNYISTHLVSTIGVLLIGTVGVSYLIIENTGSQNDDLQNMVENKEALIINSEDKASMNNNSIPEQTPEYIQNQSANSELTDNSNHSITINKSKELNNTEQHKNNINNNVYDTIKVPVTKTIYKTKTRIITDTVRIKKQILVRK